MRPQSFPASRRIRKRRDFLQIYDSGKKRHTAHFLLFVHFQKGEKQRLGISVSRKIGNAVARNRVKRVLREYFRTLPYCLPGRQLVVVAKQGAPKLGLAAVTAEFSPLVATLASPAGNNLSNRFPDC